MKDNQMHIRYITAILLFTLSWYAQAAQCNEQDWNKALISQEALDRKYNLLAIKYNQWLPTFHDSVFLYKEFSPQELEYLWNKNSNSFQQKVAKQISFALKSRQSINDFIQHIPTIPPLVDKQIVAWKALKQACSKDKLITNEIAADHYIDSNSVLKKDLNDLLTQLKIMHRFYDHEIVILQNLSESSS